jgi:predicted NBD/HSP70 family sugar kinase
MPYLGIEIGGPKLQSAVVDAAGRILFARTETVAADPDGPLARIAAGRPADARHLAGAIAAGAAPSADLTAAMLQRGIGATLSVTAPQVLAV